MVIKEIICQGDCQGCPLNDNPDGPGECLPQAMGIKVTQETAPQEKPPYKTLYCMKCLDWEIFRLIGDSDLKNTGQYKCQDCGEVLHFPYKLEQVAHGNPEIENQGEN